MDEISREQVQASLNSYINWEPSVEETVLAEPVTPEAEPVQTEPEQKPVESEPTPDKPKSSFAKLLSERNEARREADSRAAELAEKDAELADMKAKLKELETKEVPEWEERSHDIEVIETIAKKNALENDLSNSKKNLDKQFYKDIPEAMEIKEKIDAIQQKHPTMNPYEAFAFYVWNLGETVESKKEAVDEQKENQKNSFDLLWSPNAWSPTIGDPANMSQAEIKEILKKGLLSGDLVL